MPLFLLAVDPPELGRGRYPAPGWLILALAGVTVAFVVGYLILRFRGGKKG